MGRYHSLLASPTPLTIDIARYRGDQHMGFMLICQRQLDLPMATIRNTHRKKGRKGMQYNFDTRIGD